MDDNEVVRGRCPWMDNNEVVHGRWSKIRGWLNRPYNEQTNVQHIGKFDMLEQLINPWLSP